MANFYASEYYQKLDTINNQNDEQISEKFIFTVYQNQFIEDDIHFIFINIIKI